MLERLFNFRFYLEGDSMNIFDLDFWYYGIAFIAAPVAFLLFSRIADPKDRVALKLVKAILLVIVCIVCSVSFVMFWHKLIEGSFLFCVTVPIALIVGFFIWRVGMTLLLADSGVTVVEFIDTGKIKSIFVVGPMAEKFADTSDSG